MHHHQLPSQSHPAARRRDRPRRVYGAALLGVALLLPTALGATSYVMPTDDELLAKSALVIVGTVEGREPAPGLTTPATDYQIRVEEVLKGYVLATDLVVRVRGGLSDSGYYHLIHGAPDLATGDRAILFLEPHAGVFRVMDLQLGVFHELPTASHGTLAHRTLAAAEVTLRGDAREQERRRSHLPRDFDRFRRWLADRAEGIEREPDYFVAEAGGLADGLVAGRAAFSSITFSCNSGPAVARWEEFDSGQRVDYQMFNAGQPGVPGGGFTQIQRGMNAWNGVSGARANLNYAGTTGNSAGGTDPPNLDFLNRVIPEDPGNVLSGSFTGSGTLASTTIIADCGNTGFFANGRYAPIVDADIIGQDGLVTNWLPFVMDPTLAWERVFTHELGHGIGLDHSCGDAGSPSCSGGGAIADAIMRANYVDSLKGRQLGSDDRASVRFLYPTAGAGNAPSPPSFLVAAAQSSSEIALAWIDNSPNEDGFLVQERDIASTLWSDLAILPSNSTGLTVENIPAQTARVYRVQSFNDSGSSTFSNEAQATTNGTIGPCVDDSDTLCLTDGRFQVTATWRTGQGTSGAGNRQTLTPDTGYFWFFSEENVEMVVKVLNACNPDLGNRFWVFAGGLTDVEVVLTVVDTDTGAAKTYFNALGQPFQPVQDTSAFETCP